MLLTTYFFDLGRYALNDEKEKIILPKELQIQMRKFFFDVAIRRKKQQQHEKRLSKNLDRGEQ